MRLVWRIVGAVGAVLIGGIVGYATIASRPGLIRAAEARGAIVAATSAAAGVAPSTSLEMASRRILRCRNSATESREGCAFAVYVWSPLMPLSRMGEAEVRRAGSSIGVDLLVMDGTQLESRAAVHFPTADGHPAVHAASAPQDGVAAEMIGAGATVHYPALLVYRAGRPVGAAILGYKTEAAYQAYLEQRLADAPPPPSSAARSTFPLSGADTLVLSVEFPVSGRPGAYFRSVPGRQSLAYEAGSVVRLLHLSDGRTSVGPGHIDFVPTPDGRLFVTPARNGGGLEFYDAAEVFAAARRGTGREVEPIHVDRALRDQYPSVGILESETNGTGSHTVYRVLTSWFDGIAFRDYEVYKERPSGRSRVRALGSRMSACPQVSLPILGPNGRELAGRDEASATTKIFRIGEEGECREVADTGLPTGKVAWSPDGGRIAFAVPRGTIRDGRGTRGTGDDDPDLAGIFIFDRRTGDLRRVPGSDDASRLAFPEFVGADSLVYLLSPQEPRGRSVFRLVCCVR